MLIMAQIGKMYLQDINSYSDKNKTLYKPLKIKSNLINEKAKVQNLSTKVKPQPVLKQRQA